MKGKFDNLRHECEDKNHKIIAMKIEIEDLKKRLEKNKKQFK